MQEVVVYNYGAQDVEAIRTSDGIVLSDEQIGIALGYADPAKAISNLVQRNAYELAGLSVTLNLRATDGKHYDTRVWGERGVMAITFLAKTKAAMDFRKWARETLFATAKRDPLTELDRFAALAAQVTQTQEAKFAAVNEKLALLEDAQKKVDPKALADQTAKEVIRRDMEVSRMKHEIRAGWVKRVVDVACKSQGPIAAEWDTYNKVWRKLHNFTGLNKFDDYRTPDVCRAAASYLEGVLKSLGGDPSQLRLVV